MMECLNQDFYKTESLGLEYCLIVESSVQPLTFFSIFFLSISCPSDFSSFHSSIWLPSLSRKSALPPATRSSKTSKNVAS